MNAENPTKIEYAKYYSSRVYRGGSWLSDAWDDRVSLNGDVGPFMRGNGLGFRLVRNK
jgi:formylglycine-generating enzyme required for sulfatase activity